MSKQMTVFSEGAEHHSFQSSLDIKMLCDLYYPLASQPTHPQNGSNNICLTCSPKDYKLISIYKISGDK